MQTYTYSHERLARLDVFSYGLDVSGLRQLREAVSKVADARDDKFLWDAKLSAFVNWRLYVYDWDMKYLCGGYVGGRFHPFDSVADFLDSID